MALASRETEIETSRSGSGSVVLVSLPLNLNLLQVRREGAEVRLARRVSCGCHVLLGQDAGHILVHGREAVQHGLHVGGRELV